MLKGKNLVLTGALQGIGKATLECLASKGANIWACALHQDDAFEAYCTELAKQYNIWIKPVYFNLLQQDEIRIGVKKIQSEKQPVDGLINIAGVAKDALFSMVSMDTLKFVFDVNFFSQMYLTQFISKLMLRNGHGSIVFVSSISALDGNIGQLAYSSSKAALIGATRTLSKELASKGIRVNAIAPGVIDTDMNKVVPAEMIAEKVAKMDIKRLGQPLEVANTIAFLMSDLSAYITGQVIRIDGGIR
ncbi:SDR family NAD(P)-dependent oxidoreductase [Bacteroides sp. AM10-21B]|uniref:SDR family NAD(P)-dependent oxidoreductase n=1 Tax=Bacteroides sp. AM10-21B TaxID=2292001 RepID=UPI0018F3F05D|nr:SDR family NAD(P)-dependent oxidoreductase [Bacteroides sp. AM10-21B]